MNTYLFFDWRARPLSITGDIMPGAVLKFFLTQTTTPAPVYADASLQTELGTEVTADEDGHFPPIYMDGSVTYRAQLFDADGVLQPDGDVDPLAPPRDHKPGEVVWFHGTVEQRDEAFPPALYQVLDGTNGTPDGRDRAVVVAGGSYASGDTGGSLELTIAEDGAHDHDEETGETALEASMVPAPELELYCWLGTGSDGEHDAVGWAGAGLAAQRGSQPSGGSFGYTDVNGSDTPLVRTSGGGNDPHAHSIVEDGAHDHEGSTVEMPPFVALWALMRRRD